MVSDLKYFDGSLSEDRSRAREPKGVVCHGLLNSSKIIFRPEAVDEIVSVSQADAEEMARRLAREEAIFCGVSSGWACWAAHTIARQVENSTIARATALGAVVE